MSGLTALCIMHVSTPPPETDLESVAILATIAQTSFFGRDMQTLSARDAKYNFGRLIDTARAEPVTVEKHRRAVVVVLAVEEYERLKTIELEQHAKAVGSGDKK
jgi:prevent-host-death family protein